jgi:hypothetical protein
MDGQYAYYPAHGQANKIMQSFTKILQLIAVLGAASILGNWYMAEYKKARSANLPLSRAYFSLPGILIILFVLLLPLLVHFIQK